MFRSRDAACRRGRTVNQTRLAEQLRQWADASRVLQSSATAKLTPLAAPRGVLAGILGARYPTATLNDLILPDHLSDEL